MYREDLMKMAAEKAINELDWKSIEWLFKPVDQFTLLLRLDFKGMKSKIYDWILDDSPSAMPHRFRPPYTKIMLRAIEAEEFYRVLKKLHDNEEQRNA